MKKSSLGRRSSSAAPQRMTLSEFENARRERISSIPVRSRTSGAGTERPSRLATSSSSSIRTSSYGGCKSKRDNRPLQDKQWQILALRKVEEVVRTIPDGRELIKNGIKPLTIKLFVEISHLLLLQLDRTIVLNNVNYMNEIPYITKLMQYHGKVDKSWLISANTPHAFAHVIGFLHFLASCYLALVQVDSLSLMYPENFCGNSQDSWEFKLLLPYLVESYKLYCSDCADYMKRQIELDKQVLLLHFRDKDVLYNQIRTLESENNKFQEIILKKKNANQSLMREIDKLKSSFEKMKQVYTREEEHLILLGNNVKEIENEIDEIYCKHNSMVSSLEEKQNILNNLQKSIDNQPVSRDDIKQIRKECEKLHREIESEGKYIDEYENKIFQEDLTIVTLQRELQSKTRNYVLMVEELSDESLIEKSKIPANIQDLDVENIENAYTCLIDIKSKYKTEQNNGNLQENKNIIEEILAKNAKLESECDNLEKEIISIKEDSNAHHLEHIKKLNELNADLSAIEDKRMQIKEYMKVDYAELAKRQNIKANKMEAELEEYNRATKYIITEKIRMFEEYKRKVSNAIDSIGAAAAASSTTE